MEGGPRLTFDPSLHRPVLVARVARLLAQASGPTIVDGTIGLGGHAEAILESNPEAIVIGVDRDEQALAKAAERLACFGRRVRLVHGNYCEIDRHLQRLNLERADALLLDLGVSSLQLADPSRGFSFRKDGPLDMRMDRSTGRPAADWIASASQEDIENALRSFGEERHARRIARRIVEARTEDPIDTTLKLRRVVHQAVPDRYFAGAIDPATRTFQAIRIVVNRELEGLQRGLAVGFGVLSDRGVLAVISFHSLEDRIVKRFFRERAADCICPPDLPECLCDKQVEAEILTRKPITPAAEEIADNPRARSAKLRAARKVAEFVPQADSCPFP